jgi:ribosome-associated heat shock protein Hsp15
MSEASVAGVRIDVWLWAARWFRTRSLAKQAVVGGKVAVNGYVAKPAKSVHIGDRLVIERSRESCDVEVLALSDQRGPASVAQALYRETEESRAARAKAAEAARLAPHIAPPGRPDKQDRRELRRFKFGEPGES